MTRRLKHFQRELKRIALHFSLQLSHIQVLKLQAIGIDKINRKMILLERKKHPHFRIVDLSKITSCYVKATYRNISAGELENKNMDEFVQKISLRMDHIDEPKLIEIIFFNAGENTVTALPRLRSGLNKLKSMLTDAIHKQIANRA